MLTVTPETAFRLLSKCTVTETKCWIWQGQVVRRKGGRYVYPIISIGWTLYLARQVAYLIIRRVKLTRRTVIKPSCGNELCLNPIHLEALVRPVKNHGRSIRE